MLGLLALEGVLYLSEQFRWFAFNEHKGWTVLIAVAGVGAALLLALLWFAASLLFRLRFQFSIRSLLLLMLVVALPCSWLSWERRKAENQNRLVEWIENMHGRANYDCEVTGDGTHVQYWEPPATEALRNLLGIDFFADIVWVRLDNPAVAATVTDAELERLKGLTQLQELWLADTQVTDAGLENLKNQGMRRVDFQRLAEMGGRLVAVSLPTENLAEVNVSIGVVGPDGQGLLVLGNRLVKPSLLAQNRGQIQVGAGGVGIDLQRFPVLGHRLVESPPLREDRAKVDVGVHVVGIDLHGSLKLGLRLVEPAPAGQQGAEVIVGHGEAGLDFLRPAITGLGLVNVAQAN